MIGLKLKKYQKKRLTIRKMPSIIIDETTFVSIISEFRTFVKEDLQTVPAPRFAGAVLCLSRVHKKGNGNMTDESTVLRDAMRQLDALLAPLTPGEQKALLHLLLDAMR